MAGNSNSGRRRKPTVLKILAGNPSKEKLNGREPMPRRGVPKCPDWISGEAKAEWNRVVPELDRLGLLTVIDGAALEGYCAAYALAVHCERAIRKYGTTYENDEGRICKRPEIAMGNEAWRMVRTFAAEFGCTPSSRGKMSIPDDAHRSALEQFIEGG
jgi:P27 family predicted phage terminase small subunit